MASILVLLHADLTSTLRDRFVDLCSDAYEEDFAPHFERLRDATHVLAMEGDRVVSHAAWVTRELRVGSHRTPLVCAYVEAVATPIALQRRGLGTHVLRAMPPLLAAFDIAALSPSELGFYARCGWERWQGPLGYIEDGQRIATPDEEVMIHRLPRTPPDLDVTEELETDWREGDVW